MEHESVLIIVNDRAHDPAVHEFIETHVLPIIVSRGWPYLLHYTLSEEEAGALAKDFIRRSKEARPSIVVAGGDGTLHNLINWVAVDAIEKDGPIPGAAFFLVPTGTPYHFESRPMGRV